MARVLLAGLLLPLLWTLTAAANCSPYGNADASHCSSDNRHREQFQNLDSLLKDAQSQEHMGGFLINITLGMYHYLHPCAKTAEAALVLYFDGHALPDASSDWWQAMGTVVGEQGLIGKRKRDSSFHSETDLLRNKLSSLIHSTGNDAGCVNYLIGDYKDSAAAAFKQQFPNFHAPTTPSPTTTTPLPTTTTEATTTTTVKQATCTNCDGLQCLLSSHVVTCPAGYGFCLTTVQDKTSGREIIRNCASRQICDNISNHAECADIETRVLSDGIRCDYCCSGDNCNKPPQLLPNNNTLYHKP